MTLARVSSSYLTTTPVGTSRGRFDQAGTNNPLTKLSESAPRWHGDRGCPPATVRQPLDLTMLAPDIQESLTREIGRDRSIGLTLSGPDVDPKTR
jgi:hypothetical protein